MAQAQVVSIHDMEPLAKDARGKGKRRHVVAMERLETMGNHATLGKNKR